MRYVDGPSLRHRISVQRRLSPEETLRIAEQIGSALDAAHAAGLVHRDVKPANILLAEPGGHAYLCDFGLAKRTSSRGATRTGSFLGSVDYCAPEQRYGLPVDPRADLFALATLTYELLAGRLPGRVYAPTRRTNPATPPALDEVLRQGLARDRDERQATIEEFVQALRRAAEAT